MDRRFGYRSSASRKSIVKHSALAFGAASILINGRHTAPSFNQADTRRGGFSGRRFFTSVCAPMRITAPAAAAAALLACLALARTASIRSMAALIEGDEKGKKRWKRWPRRCQRNKAKPSPSADVNVVVSCSQERGGASL